MESRLPDINTEFINYRNEVRMALKSGNYRAMIGYINNLNALLPDHYQVKISTEEYNKIVKSKELLICPGCKKESNQDDIKVRNKLNPPFELLLSGNEYEKIWTCTACKEEIMMKNTEFMIEKLSKPHYFQIVPDPPTRSKSLTDMGISNSRFKILMQDWTYNCMAEIAHQESKYREEYVPKDTEFAETQDDNKLEEGMVVVEQ